MFHVAGQNSSLAVTLLITLTYTSCMLCTLCAVKNSLHDKKEIWSFVGAGEMAGLCI